MSQKTERDDKLLQDLEKRNKECFQRLRRMIHEFKKAVKHDSEDRGNDNSLTSGPLAAM